jgi:hypothetical protein
MRHILFPAVLLAGILSLQAADLYHVAGTVIDVQTGSPMSRAQVYVYLPGKPVPRVPFITSADGHFTFDLPEGGYVLRAGTRTTSEIYGTRNPDNPIGSAVIVGAGHDTSNLVFHWFPPAAITGGILDDSGEPVEGALVQLLRSSVRNGHRTTTSARFERTNDIGEYRFGWIPGGARYYIAVTGKPWYGPSGLARESGEHHAAYIPAYYPNTADPARAAPILLKPGEEARADFTLTPVSGATVSVKHDAPVGMNGLLSLRKEGVAGTTAFQEQQGLFVLPGQAQVLPGVPPGRYVVQVTATNGKLDLAGRTTIDVNATDVAVELTLHPQATVSGIIRFKNPDVKSRRSMVASLVNVGAVGTISAAVRPDGSFVIPSVPAGKYRPALASAENFIPTAVEVTGAVYRNQVIELTEGDSATISIITSDEVGTLKGAVMNGETPAEAVLAVLVPTEAPETSSFYYSYQTESDGTFSWRNILAGRYYLFAVDDTGLEYANPVVVQPYLSNAKLVTIEAHSSSTERLSLTRPKAP